MSNEFIRKEQYNSTFGDSRSAAFRALQLTDMGDQQVKTYEDSGIREADRQSMAGVNQGVITDEEKASAVTVPKVPVADQMEGLEVERDPQLELLLQDFKNVPVEDRDKLIGLRLQNSPYPELSHLLAQKEAENINEPSSMAKFFLGTKPQSELDARREGVELAKDYIAQGQYDNAMAILKPEQQAVQETVNPAEFVFAGAGATARLAGKEGLKIFAKAIPLGLPFETAAAVGVDEYAQDHPIVGFGLDMAFGVAFGMGSERIVTGGRMKQFGKALSDIVNDSSQGQVAATAEAFRKRISQLETVDPLDFRNIQPSRTTVREVGTYAPYPKYSEGSGPKLMEGKAISQVADETPQPRPLSPHARKKGKTKVVAEAVVQQEAREAAATEARSVWTRRAAQEAHMTSRALDIGDLRTTSARNIAKNLVEEAQNSSDLTPEVAKVLEQTKKAIEVQEAKSGVAQPKYDQPSVENINPALSQREVKAITAKVEGEWLGATPTKTGWKGEAVSEYQQHIQWANPEIDDVKAAKLAQAAVAKDQARGLFGKNFQDDLRNEISVAVDARKAAGKDINMGELIPEVREALVKEYRMGINTDIADMSQALPPNPLSGLKTTSIAGGIEELDPKFMAPPGEIVAMQGGGYKFMDWDITNRIEYSSDANNLVFMPPKAQPEIKGPNTNKSRLFDYDKVQTEAEAQAEIDSYIGQLFTKAATELGETTTGKKFVKLKGFDNLSHTFKFWNKQTNKETSIFSKPKDQEEEALAKLFGWDDTKLTPVTVKAKPELGSETGSQSMYFTEPADIAKNNAKWVQKYDENPQYFVDMGKYGTEGMDNAGNYWGMVFGRQYYEGQREAFIKKGIGSYMRSRGLKGSDILPWTAKRKAAFEKNQEKAIADYHRDVYQAIRNRFMVARSNLARDAADLAGSPYETQAKMQYLRLKDTLSGSNSVDTINGLTRAQVREQEWYDSNRYSQERMTAMMENNQASKIEGGEPTKVRPAKADSDPSVEELGKTSDMVGANVQATKVDEASEMLDTKLTSKAGDEAHETFNLANLQNDARAVRAMQANEIENRIGSRIIDDLYEPSIAGGLGKVNYFKINSVEDINAMLAAYNTPIQSLGETTTLAEAMGKVDSFGIVGVEAYEGLSTQDATRLTYAISDVNKQVTDLADKLLQHPDDLLTAVAFDKMKTISAILTDQLAYGSPLKNNLVKLKQAGINAYDDKSLIDQMAKVVEDNYSMFGKLNQEDNLRPIVAIAQMVRDMDSPQSLGQFMKKLSKVSDQSQIAKEESVLLNTRRAITKKLEEACGAA